MKNIAILPARGGSKSIPKKNIVDLCGSPLICHAIFAIKNSGTVERIIVSTDDPIIAETAKKCSPDMDPAVEAPFLRPKEISGDSAPTIPAIEHAIRWLADNENYKPDCVLVVQPTSPFIKPEEIKELFNLMIDKKADSGITMIRVPRVFHPYHIRKQNEGGFLEFRDESMHYIHSTRQSDPPFYAFGNIYWFKCDTFLSERKLEVGKRVGLEIGGISAFDINDTDDIKIARCIFKTGTE